jgi:hypothetical protein
MLKKVIIALAVLSAGYAFAVIRFPHSETPFECAGLLRTSAGATDAAVSVKLRKYHWFLAPFRDSAGNLVLEIPGADAVTYSRVMHRGDQRQIWDGDTVRGSLSLAGQVLTLETREGVFEGKCRQT